MIGLTTGAVERFTPPWAEAAAPRVFLLRAGSMVERAQLEAELAGEYMAGEVWPFELEAVFAEGLGAIADAEDAERILSIVAQEAAGEPVDDSDRALLAQARDLIKQHWPAYRALLAQEQRRQELAPVLAFRRFCTGWEGVDAKYEARAGLVTDAAMKAVNPLELRAAGLRAFRMLYATGADAEKNFAAPSPSSDGQPISGSADPSKAGGASETITGA